MAHNAKTRGPLVAPHDEDAPTGARQQIDPPTTIDTPAPPRDLPPDVADLLDFLSLWMYEVALYKWEKKAREEARQRASEDNDTTTARSMV